MSRQYWCCVIAVYVVTFLVLVPYFTEDMPYSALFKMTLIKEFVEKRASVVNENRVQTAMEYINSLVSSQSLQFYQTIWNEHRYDTVIVIVTVARPAVDGVTTGYLTQTAAMFDKIIKSSTDASSYFLFLCNIDAAPLNHSEAHALEKYMPTMELYGHRSLQMVIGNTMTTQQVNNRIERLSFKTKAGSSRTLKEKNDYLFCLQTAYDLKSEKILIVEDDAVPKKELFNVLSVLVNTRLRYSNQNEQDRRHELAFLKLYFPQRILGYYNHVRYVFEILAIGLIGGALNLLIFLLINYRSGTARGVSIAKSYAIYGAGLVFSALFCQAIGRQNLQELRRISPYLYTLRSAPHCCTQATLYFSSFVPLLMEFLQTSKDTRNFDLIISDFMDSQSNWFTYYVEPNLFDHVGMYSSLRPGEHTAAEDFLFKLTLQ